MSKPVIKEGYLPRLLLIILGIFLFFSFLSALFLYRSLHLPLGPHYGAMLSIVAQVRESLLIKTITINLIFFVLTAIGVMLLGILYSHRIVGPLCRVKQYASALGQGRFSERIAFRKKDAVHALSSALNETAEGCEKTVKRFAHELRELENDLKSLASLTDRSEEKEALIGRLRELDERIRADCRKIRL